MKKYVWIVALIAALALVFVGCDTGGGGTKKDITIKFNLNGGSGTPPPEQTFKSGGKAQEPAVPTEPTGYTFGGWTQVVNTKATIVDFSALAFTSDATLYALWFKENDPSENPAPYNPETGRPATPGQENQPPAGGDDDDDDDDIPTGAIELGEYTVFGGEAEKQAGWASAGYSGAPDTAPSIAEFLTAEYLVVVMENPLAGGMQFIWQGIGGGITGSEWNQNDITTNSGEPVEDGGLIITTKSNGDTVLTFNLSLACNSTNDTKKYEDYVKANGGVKLLIAYYTGPDYLDGLGIKYAYLIPGDAPVIRHTVTFDAVDGEVDPATMQVTDGFPISPWVIPVLDGWAFDGWFDEDEVAYTNTTPITANVTLYAQWVKLHTVSFVLGADEDENPPEEIESIEVKDGASMGAAYPATPMRIDGEEKSDEDGDYTFGWVFNAWYDNEDFDGEPYDATTPIEDDTVLYAEWVEGSTVTITFMFDDEEYFKKVLPRGEALGTEFPRAPKEPGKVFGGWFDEDGELADIDGETVFTGHQIFTASSDDFEEVEPFIVELGAFSYDNGVSQKGWSFGPEAGAQLVQGTNAQSFDTIYNAKYLVIGLTDDCTLINVTKVDDNDVGLGGLQTVFQPNYAGWVQTNPWGDGIAFLEGVYDNGTLLQDELEKDSIYIVIQLDKLNGYDAMLAATRTRLVIAYYSANLSAFGEGMKVYLTNKELDKPDEGTVDIPNGGGFITTNADFADQLEE